VAKLRCDRCDDAALVDNNTDGGSLLDSPASMSASNILIGIAILHTAVLNLCRDEISNSLKTKVEAVFGESFNLHGLGAVLTCGTTGIGACMSHAPHVSMVTIIECVFLFVVLAHLPYPF